MIEITLTNGPAAGYAWANMADELLPMIWAWPHPTIEGEWLTTDGGWEQPPRGTLYELTERPLEIFAGDEPWRASYREVTEPETLESEARRRRLEAVSPLDGGRELTIQLMGAGQGRLTVGPRPGYGRYEDAWDYPTVQHARAAMEAWDGHADPPDGWTRNLSTNRRRPGGDPGQEYVRP